MVGVLLGMVFDKVLQLQQELGELYSKYQKQGLVILGFPCNQFNNQEPGNNKEIKQFAKSKGADFPMMSKVEVNGANGMYNYSVLAGLLIVCTCLWKRSLCLLPSTCMTCLLAAFACS